MENNLRLSFGNSSVGLKLADFNSGLLANADLTGLATVSLTESRPNEIVSIPTIWRDSKTNTVVRVCLPTSFLRGAWRSKHPVAFLSEVVPSIITNRIFTTHQPVN